MHAQARLESGEPTPEAIERAALAVAPKHSEAGPLGTVIPEETDA